jgi:hypothetical protein
LLEFSHICSFERHGTEEHGVENDTGTPDVGLETAIAFSLEDLGRNVRWGTTLLMLLLILALHQFTDSKIANLYITFGGQQYVVELDVSVEDPLAVHVHEALDQLAEDMLSQVFLKLSAAAHVRKKIATSTNLHDVNSM